MNPRMMTNGVKVLVMMGLLVSASLPAFADSTAAYDNALAVLADSDGATYDLTITEDTTWSGYVVPGRVKVTNGATLTIAAGTYVDFATAESNGHLFLDGGHLLCNGTQSGYIILTSTAADQGSGKWIGITTDSYDTPVSSTMDYTIVTEALGGFGMFGSQTSGVVNHGIVTNCYFGYVAYDGGTISGSDNAAADCSVGFLLDTQGSNLINSQALRCETGYNVRYRIEDSSAENCDVGFKLSTWAASETTLVDNITAEDCSTGLQIFGAATCTNVGIENATDAGIYISTAYSVGRYVSLSDVSVVGTTDGPGLSVYSNDRDHEYVTVTSSIIRNNRTNVQMRSVALVGLTAPLLLGRGNDAGNNNILGGPLTVVDVENQCGKATLYAEHCYWGQGPDEVPTPTLIGSVDFRPYLIDGIIIHEEGPAKSAAPEASLTSTAYPNPFNPSTTIAFDLPRESSDVRLDVLDVRGRLVKNLSDGTMTGRRGQVQWTGTDNNGGIVAAGVYFYRLVVDGQQQDTGKLVLTK